MALATLNYQHQPLPTPRSIRILRLRPNPSKWAVLECSLVPVSLDESPRYWALSYAWGAGKSSHPIFCQQGSSMHRLGITPNCAAALYQLRSTAAEEVSLWVDSICIDQTSTPERSSQVALMDEVYLGAERVVVWLGEIDPPKQHAIDLMKQIAPSFSSVDMMAAVSDGKWRDAARRAGLQLQAHSKARELTKGMKSEAEDKFGAVFRTEWFRRMWTVQEVTLPLPDKVEVRCGDASISWLEVFAAADILNAIGYEWGAIEPAMKLMRYISQIMIGHRVPAAKEFMKTVPGMLSELTVSLLLYHARPKLATKPEDKVYAMYGLLEHFGVKLPAPNYDKTLAEVYAEITAAAIEHDNTLFPLYFVSSDRRRDGLPSWVPDWSDSGWSEDESRYPETTGRFKASGGSKARWNFLSDRREMVVYGKIVDTVAQRAGSFILPGAESEGWSKLIQLDPSGRIAATEDARRSYEVYKTMRHWVEVAHQGKSYPTGESIGDALKKTLVSDNPDVHAQVTDAQFRGWLAMMRKAESEQIAGVAPEAAAVGLLSIPPQGTWKRLGAAFSSRQRQEWKADVEKCAREEIPIEVLSLLAVSSAASRRYHSYSKTFSEKKTFFRTQGGYFGVAPDMFPGSLQAGDVVALVAGLATPMVLRKEESNFRLVSHCYVHGMMYGATWEKVQENLDPIVLVCTYLPF